MEGRDTSKRWLKVPPWAAKRLTDDLEETGNQGSAIASTAKLLSLLLTMRQTEPCPQCKEDHGFLTSAAVQGGLYLALEALGMDIARKSETLEVTFKEAGEQGNYQAEQAEAAKMRQPGD